MGMLQIEECKGFTKDEAFAHLKFNPNSPVIPGTNATQSWNKAGRPNVNTNEFRRFVAQQLEEKTKNQPGYGIHIVLDPPVKDMRRRPYTIVNNKATGTREWKFVYCIREDVLNINLSQNHMYDENGDLIISNEETKEISVTEPGLIVEICDSKAEALDKMKKLITKTHKCYSILAMKIPDIAPIAAFGLYTPSSGAKKGTFIACGINQE